MHEYPVLEMARLQLEGRQITIGDPHALLTNLDEGT